MKTCDPGETDDKDELKEIAFYWLQKSAMLHAEYKGLKQVLKDRGIEITVAELCDAMNKAAGHGS